MEVGEIVIMQFRSDVEIDHRICGCVVVKGMFYLVL